MADVRGVRTRVLIRPPTARDAKAFIEAVRRSRSLHRSWVAPPSTLDAYSSYLERVAANSHRGFLVIRRDTRALAGVFNIGHIIRGSLNSAYLGYYGFAGSVGQGFMTEGLQLVLRHAFQKLRLHRLEANIQPDNEPSRLLVKRCGFVREGFSRRYLKVAGRWRDHERWAILAEDFARQHHGRSTTPNPARRHSR